MNLFIMVGIAVTYLIHPRIGALFLLSVAVYYLFVTKGSICEKLLKIIVYSTSYYTFDIFGGRQRLSVCIVAIAFLCIFLTLNMLKRGAKVSRGSACKLILLFIFVAAYFLSVLGSHEPIETIFATYHLVFLGYLIFIIPISKNEELKNVDTNILMELFVTGICAVAMTLYIQYAANTLLGVSLGEVFEYNSNRVIYNVYFYSKSVLSLYLAVGMLYFFIDYINQKH